jgi:hypothetical protein
MARFQLLQNIRELRKHPALLWDKAAKWQWFAVLFLGGLGAVSIPEYGLALFLLFLSGLSAASKTHHWNGVSSKFWTVTFKVGGVSAVFGGFILCFFTAIAIKGDGPWSHLPQGWNRMITFVSIKPNTPSVGIDWDAVLKSPLRPLPLALGSMSAPRELTSRTVKAEIQLPKEKVQPIVSLPSPGPVSVPTSESAEAVNKITSELEALRKDIGSSSQAPRPLVEADIPTIRAETVFYLNSAYKLLQDTRDYADWIRSNTGSIEKQQFYIGENNGEFLRDYDKNFGPKAAGIRNALLRHIRDAPHSDRLILYLYNIYELPPGRPRLDMFSIEAQLNDLRNLLNELEKENGLPLSCQTLVLRHF